ncbi:GNAT family N-acetyltransferase [Leifsonia sp. NPDC058230]|uniref:GNAT family N-acetyltransferase n=1 Tax=Leifsonia sp. NPDC058230 TaxID=3346391 RepID=UPI0036DF372F
MAPLTIAEITEENLDAAVALKLAPGQERFVAPVVASIAQAYVTPTAWPRVVLDGDDVVGFIMGNFDPGNELEAFRAGIWRLNVAGTAQGRGVGRFAIEALEVEARRRGVARITVLWEEGEGGPDGFYRRLGFEPTGEVLFGEILAAKDVPPEPDPAATRRDPVSRVVVQDAVLAHPVTVTRIETRRISIEPNVAAGLHVHNGPVVGSIERGSAIYQVEGGEPRVLRAGDVFYEPQGARVSRFDGGRDGVTFLGHFPVTAEDEPTIEFPEA